MSQEHKEKIQRENEIKAQIKREFQQEAEQKKQREIFVQEKVN